MASNQKVSIYFIFIAFILLINVHFSALCHDKSLSHKRLARQINDDYSSLMESSEFYASRHDTFQGASNENHKPVFKDCATYKPSVKEDEDEGTYVFQVKAYDRDPVDNGGNITYTFVSAPTDKKRFHITPSGVITTAIRFDRDEPVREKEVYITVRATDNGRPQLDDVCTIKVTIEDKNDNPPVFDKVHYYESVPQDLPNGSLVMRVSATDIDDGNNSIVVYSLLPSRDEEYFRMDNTTGIIYLIRTINKEPGYRFRLNATARDLGDPPMSTLPVNVDITVVESNKKPPAFTYTPEMPIYLMENLTDYNYNIATLRAKSNDEKDAVFELVTGRTEQTNKLNTFMLISDGNTAYIRKGNGKLDYESTPEYFLTVRIQNKFSLAAETILNIQLIDVNDNIPVFTDVSSEGVVPENEPAGTPVMQVRAVDADGTSAYNRVTYELADNTENFEINPESGYIQTKRKFDREVQDVYNVKVIASDNAPSALYTTGIPNRGQQVFKIKIADKNDHPPKFTDQYYVAEAIREDANINQRVIQVSAKDVDTASMISYTIVDGNGDDSFMIDDKTGEIRVNKPLDYETKKNYTLKVKAFDGIYEDYCEVSITILNINDQQPVFVDAPTLIELVEETLVPNCIATFKAYDPDIEDRSAPQNIVYSIVKVEQREFLKIDEKGCLSLLKPLDRDPPDGSEKWQVFISAHDEGQGTSSLQTNTQTEIILTDINDNAPFLNMTQPVVWDENQDPGEITKLEALDYDGPKNGPPFAFSIAPTASLDIQSKFSIISGYLNARVKFDREEKKFYLIPVAISDSGVPVKTGTSTLTVVIGDVNDNPMKEGSSSILVYNFQGKAPDTTIGRIFVDDLDDWDLPDKEFLWADNTPHPSFTIDRDGNITMLSGTTPQSYQLEFKVTERPHNQYFDEHSVLAHVNVTVKDIPEEAVDRSGSIRITGTTAEEFIKTDSNGISKRVKLQKYLAKFFNISEENVDVFTVIHSPLNKNLNELDVRFSAHSSPYYYPEKLNAAVDLHISELEKELGVYILMVSINECLIEKSICENSCSNFLYKDDTPYVITTNTSSFVGVNATVNPVCNCDFQPEPFCFNGGTMGVDHKCVCQPGFDGPNCEIVSIGFSGDGWALYPSLESCDDSRITLDVQSNDKDGLLFYIGPTDVNKRFHLQDFMSLEIQDGFPVLLVDYGSGTVKLHENEIRLDDGKHHKIDIIWSKTTVELQVDNCKSQTCNRYVPTAGSNEFLNVNGPLQIGGSYVDFNTLHKHLNWTFKPSNIYFSGCISNFTFNNKFYNLGMPGYSKNADIGCSAGLAVAASFGVDSSFLIAFFLCLAVLLLLLVFVFVHRKKTHDLYDSDDVIENIINYEEEGGGEGDINYDMNVLQLRCNGKKPYNEPVTPIGFPDVCGIINGSNEHLDGLDTGPPDDVRHYAYEGESHSSGSLSSLASGTDDGDLNFEYLSDFGPRFRKLADMYGEEPSEDEEDLYESISKSPMNRSHIM